MKKFTVILIISLLLSGNAYAKVKSKDITFPDKFYTKEIKSCSALPNNVKFSIVVFPVAFSTTKLVL